VPSGHKVIFDCTLIGDASLDVSPACHYHSQPTLLLNVLGQIAAFLVDKKEDAFGRLGRLDFNHGIA
jgi:hypothetical protein